MDEFLRWAWLPFKPSPRDALPVLPLSAADPLPRPGVEAIKDSNPLLESAWHARVVVGDVILDDPQAQAFPSFFAFDEDFKFQAAALFWLSLVGLVSAPELLPRGGGTLAKTLTFVPLLLRDRRAPQPLVDELMRVLAADRRTAEERKTPWHALVMDVLEGADNEAFVSILLQRASSELQRIPSLASQRKLAIVLSHIMRHRDLGPAADPLPTKPLQEMAGDLGKSAAALDLFPTGALGAFAGLLTPTGHLRMMLVLGGGNALCRHLPELGAAGVSCLRVVDLVRACTRSVTREEGDDFCWCARPAHEDGEEEALVQARVPPFFPCLLFHPLGQDGCVLPAAVLWLHSDAKVFCALQAATGCFAVDPEEAAHALASGVCLLAGSSACPLPAKGVRSPDPDPSLCAHFDLCWSALFQRAACAAAALAAMTPDPSLLREHASLLQSRARDVRGAWLCSGQRGPPLEPTACAVAMAGITSTWTVDTVMLYQGLFQLQTANKSESEEEKEVRALTFLGLCALLPRNVFFADRLPRDGTSVLSRERRRLQRLVEQSDLLPGVDPRELLAEFVPHHTTNQVKNRSLPQVARASRLLQARGRERPEPLCFVVRGPEVAPAVGGLLDADAWPDEDTQELFSGESDDLLSLLVQSVGVLRAPGNPVLASTGKLLKDALLGAERGIVRLLAVISSAPVGGDVSSIEVLIDGRACDDPVSQAQRLRDAWLADPLDAHEVQRLLRDKVAAAKFGGPLRNLWELREEVFFLPGRENNVFRVLLRAVALERNPQNPEQTPDGEGLVDEAWRRLEWMVLLTDATARAVQEGGDLRAVIDKVRSAVRAVPFHSFREDAAEDVAGNLVGTFLAHRKAISGAFDVPGSLARLYKEEEKDEQERLLEMLHDQKVIPRFGDEALLHPARVLMWCMALPGEVTHQLRVLKGTGPSPEAPEVDSFLVLEPLALPRDLDSQVRAVPRVTLRVPSPDGSLTSSPLAPPLVPPPHLGELRGAVMLPPGQDARRVSLRTLEGGALHASALRGTRVDESANLWSFSVPLPAWSDDWATLCARWAEPQAWVAVLDSVKFPLAMPHLELQCGRCGTCVPATSLRPPGGAEATPLGACWDYLPLDTLAAGAALHGDWDLFAYLCGNDQLLLERARPLTDRVLIGALVEESLCERGLQCTRRVAVGHAFSPLLGPDTGRVRAPPSLPQLLDATEAERLTLLHAVPFPAELHEVMAHVRASLSRRPSLEALHVLNELWQQPPSLRWAEQCHERLGDAERGLEGTPARMLPSGCAKAAPTVLFVSSEHPGVHPSTRALQEALASEQQARQAEWRRLSRAVLLLGGTSPMLSFRRQGRFENLLALEETHGHAALRWFWMQVHRAWVAFQLAAWAGLAGGGAPDLSLLVAARRAARWPGISHRQAMDMAEHAGLGTTGLRIGEGVLARAERREGSMWDRIESLLAEPPAASPSDKRTPQQALSEILTEFF